jgi:uncharacterized protein YegJ (DUF2314 family)
MNLNSPIPKNEIAQWTFMAVTVAVGIITFIAMRHQIKLNKLQLDELRKKQA